MQRLFTHASEYLRNSPIPALLLNNKGMILEWNAAALELFPFLDKTAQDTYIASCILQNSTEETTVQFEYLLNQADPFFVFDFTLCNSDKEELWFKLLMQRQKNGEYFALIDDISLHKQKESHLKQAKEDAEKASVTRSQFLANISHEIRTPIQTIIGMMELLSDTHLDEEQTEYVRQVKFSADVMLTLINDILDISKVEAGQLKIEKIQFTLSDTVERSVDLVSMEAHKKGLEIGIYLDPKLPTIIIGDPNRLQQIILNLVKNAVKFTAKGQILLKASIRSAVPENEILEKPVEYIHFDIIDTGIGITTEVQKNLFTQFFQADSSTNRKFGGTGLGLAISRNIVSLMKGTIGAKKNPTGGSIFWFQIPLIRSDVPEPKRHKPQNPHTRFLLVDDNKQTLAILTRMLISIGYKDITFVKSGADALEKLRDAQRSQRPFEIIFIDMVMPEMDGWRLAAELNQIRQVNPAQLYLMVPEGSFGAEAKMKLLEWFKGYLYKPIKRHMLEDLLHEHWHSSVDIEIVEELEPVDEEPQKTETPNTPKGKGLTVLVVEDHPVNRKLLSIFIEKEGASVISAEDGIEATEAIQKHSVDLVFMDIQMPRMNGYEASTWMRDHGYTIPIIACTASAQPHEKEQCLSMGMTDILPKPYRRTDVMEILTYYSQKKESIRMEKAHSHTHEITIFDRDLFFDIMGGDMETGRVLLREYIAQTEAHLGILAQEIKTPLSPETREVIHQTGHLIKGSSLNITAKKLASVAYQIEKEAHTLEKEPLGEYISKMKEEFNTLVDLLHKEIL